MAVDPSAQPETFVLLGRIIGPHGIQGELKVRPFTAVADNFSRYRKVYLAADEEQGKVACTNIQARVHGNTVILRLAECADRNRAEALSGMGIWLNSRDLPPAGADEFYLYTLEGKRATTTAGESLGTISGLLSGAQDLLVVRNDREEFLVPIVRPFIAAITDSEVVLDLPPGFLDINRGKRSADG